MRIFFGVLLRIQKLLLGRAIELQRLDCRAGYRAEKSLALIKSDIVRQNDIDYLICRHCRRIKSSQNVYDVADVRNAL